jgi:hypothetical protein
MKRTIRTLIASSLLVSLSTPAFAVPTLYPRAGNRLPEVQNRTNAVVIADSADRNQLWVLPPLKGQTQLSGVFAGANVGFCREMTFLQSAGVRLAQRVEANSLELETTYAPELESLRQQKRDLLVESETFYANPIADAIRDLSDAIEDADMRTEDLRAQRDACGSSQCEDEITDEIDAINEQRKADRAELADLRRQHREEYTQHTRLKRQADAVELALDDIEALVGRKLAAILKTKNMLNDMFAQYAKLEGGFGNFSFQSGWQDAVATIRDANPSFHVQPVATHDARLYTTLVPGTDSPNYLESLPIVLNYSVAGRDYNPNNPVQSLASFPESIGSNARLSLVGMCPIQFPEDWPMKRQDGVPLFGLTATYSYDSAFKTTAVATYNLHKIYEYYKKVETRGGFFSSSTKVTEWKNESGSPVIEVTVTDESGLSNDEINAIKEEVATLLLQDVLMAMGVPAPGGDGLNPITPPPTGATVLANGLNATCGWSIWCVGGGWILRGLQAIFGGSSAEASYKSTFDVEASRTYSLDRTQPRGAMVTY